MEKTVKVGMMPGKINEYVVEVGASVADVLELAELCADGYDVKVDGTKVEPSTTTVGENTSLILLAKQVKGNAEKTIKVGMMPGKIEEYVVEVGTSIGDVLELAELDSNGYDIKMDGAKVGLDATVSEGTSLILLAKQVKGNAEKTIKIGVMPGKINEYVVEVGTTVSEALRLAELDPSGYDVKVDGNKVEPTSATVSEGTSLILLAKQVKGNSINRK